MSIKQYQFFCDHCGYKRFTKGDDIKDLIQVQQSAVPRGVPYIDPVTKKLTTPPPLARPKQFKCPGCGYLIKAKQIQFVETPNEQTDWPNGSQTSPPGSPIPGELI